jgi:ribulose-5-phosphate 4-epimerase/fuculose-1-phosphate aldolase
MERRDGSVRGALVELAQRLLAAGLISGTSGNLSARLGDRVLITPSGVPYADLTEDSIVALDLDGRPARPGLKPSVDAPIHCAVYRARPELGGFVHTHSPHAVAFAIVGEAIPPLQIEAAGYLGGAVRLMDYLPPADPSVAERVPEALGGDRAILLPNHGVYAVGETVDAAFSAAQIVEDSARVAWLARTLGTPRELPRSEIDRLHEFIHHRYGQR